MKNYGICKLPFVPMRSKAEHRSEMISQLIFGEYFEILESAGNWHFIKLITDGYQGWIHAWYTDFVKEEEACNLSRESKFYCADIFGPVDGEIPETIIGWGCPLPGWNGKSGKMTGLDYEYTGEVIKADKSYSFLDIFDLGEKLLNIPYLWGGRTSFGLDCSGFVQTLYRFWDTELPRDSSKQAETGIEIPFELIKAGDLAFFQNNEGQISHVGICTDMERILHVSDSVRLDYFTKDGIINTDSMTLTHKLKFVKRMN